MVNDALRLPQLPWDTGTMKLALAVLALLATTLPGYGAAVAPSQQESVIPIPLPKPPRAVAKPSATPWPDGSGWSSATVKNQRAACASLLAGKAIAWSPLAPIGKEGGCGAAAPIAVTTIDGVVLSPGATITCPLAAALHDWITTSVQPAAQKDLRTRVTAIHTASSYACRLRNNRSSGKLSEHGHANALDMAGFSFAKKNDVTVQDGWGGILHKVGLSKSGGFLADIRTDACTYFTTVLGPGSDAYHGDHFHVDVLQRKNGWRVCK